MTDDGSDDGTDAVVDRFATVNSGINTKYLWQTDRGWRACAARNRGAAAASGDAIVFLDSDVLLSPGALSSYNNLFNQNRDRVVSGYVKYLRGMNIGTKDVTERWDSIWEMRLPPNTVDQGDIPIGQDMRESLFERGLAAVEPFGDENRVFITPLSLISANMMFPRHIFEKVGGFDESILEYGYEDADLSLAVADAGFGFSYSRNCGGCHVAHSRAPIPPDRVARWNRFLQDKWSHWFKEDGKPIWNTANWKHPAGITEASANS